MFYWLQGNTGDNLFFPAVTKERNIIMGKKWKHIFKRSLAVFLAVVLCASLSYVPVLAEGTGEAEGDVSAVADDLEITGDSSMGGLVAQTLSEERALSDEGTYISGLTVSGSTAQVTYATVDAGDLVVAVYDQDTGQMLASGDLAVQGGQRQLRL